MASWRTLRAELAEARVRGELPYSLIDRVLKRQDALDGELSRILAECGNAVMFDDLVADKLEEQGRPLATGTTGASPYQRFLSRTQILDADEEIRMAKRIEFARRRLERTIALADVPPDTREQYFNRIETPEEARVSRPGAGHTDPPGEDLLEIRWAEYLRLRNDLIEANLPLVERIALRYRTYGIPHADLAQHGDIGLIRAATKFDWRKNVRFRTYAEWWIRQAIERATDTDRDVIHVPRPMRQRLSKANRLNRAMGRDMPLDSGQFARMMDVDRGTAARVFSIKSGITSLDQSNLEEDRPMRGDLIGPDLSHREEREESEYLRSRLGRMLGQLPEREQRVISLRYGLSGDPPRTLEEVGRLLDISRERVRQLQLRAIDQLRTGSADPRTAV